MLSRLGIALHWLSVVWAVSWIIIFMVMAVAGGFDSWSEGTFFIVGVTSLYVFPVMGLGWIANFIFNNHKHPFPWHKVKTHD